MPAPIQIEPAATQSYVVTSSLDSAQTASTPLKTVASALAEGRLTCAFQPVVTTRNTDMPAFYECLVRIRDRSGRLLPAAEFMPAIEHDDIARLVDRAILRKALRILSTTQRVRLSVNLSANGVGDQGWLSILESFATAAPGSTEFLVVEITESAVLDLTPEKLAFLFRIRELGCSIALDDFGAGHTSIGHLGKFRFDFLKIDGSFMDNFACNPDNQFLVKAMVSIARHFDMVCVAERVETAEEARLLTEMGVDCLQGYAFGKPEMEPDWMPLVPTHHSVSQQGLG